MLLHMRCVLPLTPRKLDQPLLPARERAPPPVLPLLPLIVS